MADFWPSHKWTPVLEASYHAKTGVHKDFSLKLCLCEIKGVRHRKWSYSSIAHQFPRSRHNFLAQTFRIQQLGCSIWRSASENWQSYSWVGPTNWSSTFHSWFSRPAYLDGQRHGSTLSWIVKQMIQFWKEKNWPEICHCWCYFLFLFHS